MYSITPRNVYVHESVPGSAEALARMERMLGCIRPDEEPVVDDEALDDISRQKRWDRVTRWRTGQYHRTRDPDIILSTYAWRDAQAQAAFDERFPHLRFARLNGAGFVGYRNGEALLASRGGICQNAYDLHSAWGCLHACDYCNIGEFLIIHLNLEETVARLDDVLAEYAWCRLWKYDNQTDQITFEPEYGASELMVSYFAGREDEYLLLYTKSDNVEHLLDLDHRGHTIISWTLSCETAAREIEKGTPTTSERIEAMRRCQEAGYHVRCRFSPIIPIRGWREENAAMVEELLPAVRPDVITMDLLAHLPGERLAKCIDVELLDPRWLAAHRALYEGQHPGKPYSPHGKQIFPHELRAELYRFMVDRIRERDAEVPISFCDETPAIWAEFSRAELGHGPERYVCTCGPDSVPGNPLLRTVESQA
ncbi:MAG: radical SAM protein [Armatimonadota bacterium]|nr:radical SAM protein [Armatimonadota bacterium]